MSTPSIINMIMHNNMNMRRRTSMHSMMHLRMPIIKNIIMLNSIVQKNFGCEDVHDYEYSLRLLVHIVILI